MTLLLYSKKDKLQEIFYFFVYKKKRYKEKQVIKQEIKKRWIYKKIHILKKYTVSIIIKKKRNQKTLENNSSYRYIN